VFDPDRWGLPDEAVVCLGDDLYDFWEQYRACFRTRTRDTSEQAYVFLRGQLTMDDQRNYANIDRRLTGGDGQGLQQFVTDSPWSGARVFRQIQAEIQAQPVLRHGGLLILDECADEKAGGQSAGAGRQHNGRLGKVDLCQVATCVVYAHPQHAVWALVDSELFLPQAWFSPAHATLRREVGVPTDRAFATKPELGLKMIQRVHAQGLPFERVACDDLYGRNRAFRAALDGEGIRYAAEVPANTAVYLKRPVLGVPRQRRRPGRKFSRLKVRSRHRPHTVGEVARRHATVWRRVQVRATERGVLEADFALQRVWTLTPTQHVREEVLVIRRDVDGRLTFVLLNEPAQTPPETLIQASCQRYFTERAFQDAKSELGWDDFQARKYRAWEHEVALTAATLWFIARVKLKWAQTYARDPDLTRQLAVAVLPALSAANVRELMQAVLPVPHLTRQQARHLVATHLVKRARSTASRLRTQHDHRESS
jgi:SRSO17 transposase